MVKGVQGLLALELLFEPGLAVALQNLDIGGSPSKHGDSLGRVSRAAESTKQSLVEEDEGE